MTTPTTPAPGPVSVSPLQALAAHTGLEVTEARLVVDRRGSRTWQTRLDDGRRLALKANHPTPDAGADAGAGRDKVRELAREAAVLDTLARAGAIDPAYPVAAGTWTAGRWLALRWYDADPLWHAFTPARDTTTPPEPTVRARLLRCATTLAARLAALHTVGWTHADVQPTNTLVADDGTTHLLDYALACGPDHGHGRAPYRGALTHTTAPETAAALLETSEHVHVQAEPPTDVWALGASLFWAFTGTRPVPYTMEDPRPAKLAAIAATATPDLAAARPWPFPELEELITRCLHPDPAQRPTAHQLATAATGAR